MRVVVPHAGPPPYGRVLGAISTAGWPYKSALVGKSDRAYFDLISGLWAAGDDFCLIEQDVEVHPTALDELDACPYDWCAFPYDYGTYGLHYGLGCVKFSGPLMARNPGAMTRVGVMSDASHPKRHWCRIDAFLQGVVLPGNGEHMHRHARAVRHLGHGNSHGCV